MPVAEIVAQANVAVPVLFFGFLFLCFFLYDYKKLHTKCPRFHEDVKKKATVCKHCGNELAGDG